MSDKAIRKAFLPAALAVLAAASSLAVADGSTDEKLLSDGFKNKSLQGWSIESTVPQNTRHAFDNGGVLTLSNQRMSKQSLVGEVALPQQHKLVFEFCEAPGNEALRWDVRYVRGTSRFDGLPFVVYQLERDQRMGFWTRSEQGWISGLPGVSALGLRDLVKEVEAARWYRVLLQNDDVFTLLRIWSLPEERVIHERKRSHDAASGAIQKDIPGQIAFSLYNYEQQPKETSLKIRNIQVFGTGGKVSENLEGPPKETASPARSEETTPLKIAVPSQVEFEFQASGYWRATTQNWSLVHEYTNGTDCTPYLSPRLTVGRFYSLGFRDGQKYVLRIQFTEDKDYIQARESDTGRLHSEFVLEHKPVREATFFPKDEKSEVSMAKVTVTPGIVLDTLRKPSAPPQGYDLVFEDDFILGLSKWGASHAKTCGYLRLDRFRHWAETGILDIPYLHVSDFILEAEVCQAEGQNGFGILFRKDVNDDASFYMFKVNTKASSSFANKFSFANDNRIPVAVEAGTKLGGMLQPRQWHTIRIVSDGDQLSGYIDGYKSAEYKDSLLKKGGVGLFLDPGTELYVRSLRVFVKKGSDFAYKTQGAETSAAKLAAVSEPFPVVPRRSPDSRVFIDARGRAHYYRVEGDKLSYDGRPYCPVRDSDGQYFVRYEPDKWPAPAYESLIETDGRTISQIEKYGLTYQIVPTQLTTHIDCTKEESGFSEDGGLGGASRILDIDGVKYRVSSARKSKNNYFLYDVLFPKLGLPYAMVYQVPNDRYRLTCVCPLPPESGSAGVVTGGPFAVDHRSYNMMHLFYPLQDKYTFCVYHQEITYDWSPGAGAAVANIWFLLIEDSLENLAPLVNARKDRPERLIGTIDQAGGFTRSLYGVRAKPADKLEKHQSAMKNYIDYVRFSGGNLVNYYFLGNDWALDGEVHYPSKIYDKILTHRYNYLDEFLAVAEKQDIVTFPRLAAFTASEKYRQKLNLATDALLINKRGDYVTVFNNRILDPLNPDVQKLFLETVDELARLVVPYSHVKGFCIDLGPGGWLSEETGYGEPTVRRFSEDTGVAVPWPENGTPYEWIKANCWDRWLDWRCGKIRDFYCRIRDRIREIRPDLELQLKFNVSQFHSVQDRNAAQQVQHLRTLGIDPALYKDETGIQFSCGFVYQDKYLNRETNLSFEDVIIPIRGRTALLDTVSYYELPAVLPKISPHFVGWLATVNLTPVGRSVLELPTMDLRKNDVNYIEFMRWEMAIAQMEHLLRRFGAAFRALPAVAPKEFKGRVEVVSGKAPDDTLAIRWYADRLMVLNDDQDARKVRITIPQRLAADEGVVELGSNRTLLKGPTEGGEATVEVDLQPFDLQVLKIDKTLSEMK